MRIKPQNKRQEKAAKAAADALWILQAAFDGDDRQWIQDMIVTVDALRFCKNGISSKTGKPLKR